MADRFAALEMIDLARALPGFRLSLDKGGVWLHTRRVQDLQGQKEETVEADLRVKLAVYWHFAETGQRPAPEEVAGRAGLHVEGVLDAYGRLRAQRVLVLDADGSSIRMAPPFSGVPTQHVVESDGVRYFANCAWDALGVPAALHRPGVIHSRCEQSGETLRLDVGLDGPSPSDWLFHCHLPAAHWWEDIVFT